MISLDTNVLIEAARVPSNRNKAIVYGALEAIEKAIEDGKDIIIPIPVMFEYLSSVDQTQRSSILSKFKAYAVTVPMDERSAHLAADIQSILRRDNKLHYEHAHEQEVVTLDVIIAAISVTEGAETIITRNVKHFSLITGALKELGFILHVMNIPTAVKFAQGSIFDLFQNP